MTDRCDVNEMPDDKHTYDEALCMASDQITAALRGTPAVIRQLTVHLSRASGKHIRAKSVLTCSMQSDGLIPGDAAKLAAAVELLHLATLVHDDIIDGAGVRRGILTLHRKFGEKPAVLCGDYLFCLALELASSIDPREDRRALVDRTLPHYMSDILLGEMHQERNNRNYMLTERQYMRIIGGKTAAMFEASFYAGYLLSDEPDSAKDVYKEIGRNIGLIFQLADDCADFEATSKKSKKPVLSDFKTGVVTLPLIYALKKDHSLLDRIKNGIRPISLKKAVAVTGGLGYTHLKIAEIFKNTEALIAALPSDRDKKDRLTSILRKAAGLPGAERDQAEELTIQ